MFEDFQPYESFENEGVELPKITLTEEELSSIDPNLTVKSSSLDVLKSLARKGIKERGIDKMPNKKDYYDRAKYEIEVFDELGFVDYILLNWDIIGYCHKNSIPVNAGRGSASSCLILYLLRVTDIDPIEHGLFFERFVSKSRAKKVYDKTGKEFLVGSLLPDVDSDISYDRRQEVIDYIETKHRGKTSKILTFNTFSSKLCIREAMKFFECANEDEIKMISDLIPKKHGVVMSLKDAVIESETFGKWAKLHKRTYENALKVEDLYKNVGVHPSGILICATDIEGLVPLQKTKEGAVVSGYDMNDVSDLAVKFDILGLRTLTIADATCKRLGITLADLDPYDPLIYHVLQDFRYGCSLFQISAETNMRVCQKVKPSNFSELSDVIALSRPASLQFVDDYVDQKRNPRKLGINDKLDDILSLSKNVMLYQEDMLRAANLIFGISLEDAEILRKIVGKKLTKDIPKWKEKIYQAAEKNGVNQATTEFFWSFVEAAGNYGFAKCHSRSYTLLAAKTILLKHKYPKEFYISVLESSQFEPNPLETVLAVSQELPFFGIKLLPPSLEKSQINFSIEGDDIRYGLNSIKGVSAKSFQALIDFRGHQFKNKYEVFVAAKECGLNIAILSALIQAGAMEDSGGDRSRLVLEAQAFNLLTEREKRNLCKIGERFGYDVLNSISEIVDKQVIGDDNKPIMPPKRFETFKKNFTKYREVYRHNRKFQKFANWWYENTLLGYGHSLTLRDCFENEFGSLMDTKQLENLDDQNKFKTALHVTEVVSRTSTAGNKYMRINAGDEKGSATLMFMDNRRERKLSDFLASGNNVSKDDVVVASGTKSGDSFFVDFIKVIDTKIYLKSSQLKHATNEQPETRD